MHPDTWVSIFAAVSGGIASPSPHARQAAARERMTAEERMAHMI